MILVKISLNLVNLFSSCSSFVIARLDIAIVDIGQPADWVKINVQKTVSLYCS